MAELKEKHLEGFPGYVIFFDNIRVDPFVKSFQVNLSCDGSIGSASFDFIYLPDFYKLEKYDPETGDVLSVEDGVENMTNVKVFIKNMFNDKYIMVFDGNIRGKNRTRTPGGYTLTFSAQDYLTWLNRTIVPIAVPQEQSIVAGDRVKWKAQGIDIDNLPGVVPVSEGVFRGKTLTEFIGQMQETTLKTNAFYSSTDGVSYWDGTQNRIKIMGDIDRDLIRNKVIDFTVTSSATFVNSMYVGINDISKNLMFEFYQDRDGYIRIKPPYWNEHVLQDHVIEPLLIMSISENTDWSAYFTRTLVTGGIEEWQEDLNEIDKAFITPCGAYVPYDNPSQDIWSDFNSGNDVVSTVEINKTNDGYTNYFLDSYSRKIRSTPLEPNIGAYKAPREGNLLHSGVDFVMPIGTPVYHRGYPGIAKSGKDRNMGLYIYVDILEGPYKGTPVFYMHLKDKVIKEGGIVTNMQLIGYSGNSGSASHDPYGYLHFQVGPGPTYRENLSRPEDFLLFKAKTDKYIAPVSKTYDPLEYLDKSLGSDNGTVTITCNGDNALLRLSPAEKKYGVSIIDMTQPLVKFTNSRLIDKNSNGIFALRKYAKFLYNITNSMVNMCNVQVMSMPWLRPGFNVWVDPVAVDKVYYIHSLSHHGSAEGGVFTMLNLTLGRERVQYATSSYFGAMGNVAGENLFISQFNMHSYDFGNTIQSNREFNTIKKKCVDFYKNESDAVIIKANQSPYFSTFYKNTNADKSGSTSSSGRLNPGTFAGDYTIDQIQYLLDTAYSTAPAVVKARASKMKRLVDGASSYIRMHYSSEYTK